MKKNRLKNLGAAALLIVTIVYAMPFAAFAASTDSGSTVSAGAAAAAADTDASAKSGTAGASSETAIGASAASAGTGTAAAAYTDAAVVTPTGITSDQIESQVDAVVNEFIGKTCPGAAVILVKDGKTVFSKGYGVADVESGTPVDPDTTVFEWGSVSKTFVWTAVMQLKEQGLIDLDAPISDYVPSDFYAKLGLRYDITMLDLMNHRAGFEDVYYDLISAKDSGPVDLPKALLNVVPKQVFKPDTVSSYSNYSAALAGYVVECITNERYADYVHDKILAPFGMNRTGLEAGLSDVPEILSDKATGYKIGEDGSFLKYGNSYVNLYPAGSMNGTAADLAKFAEALVDPDGALFENQETEGILFTDTYRSSPELDGCAHGFWEYTGEVKAYGHVGNTNAFSAYLMVSPEDHFGFVILANRESETDIFSRLDDLFLGAKKVTDLPEAAGTLPDVSEFTGGTYVVSRGSFTAPIFGQLGMMGMMTFEKAGDNKIALRMLLVPSEDEIFTQTSPGIFTADKPGGTAPKILFVREGGRIVSVSLGSDSELVSLDSMEGASRTGFVICAAIYILAILFAVLSLPVYIGIGIANLIRRPAPDRILSRGSRQMRLAARLAVGSAVLSAVNIFTLLLRELGYGDLSKTTFNLHTYAGILILLFFLAMAGVQVWLLLRKSLEIRPSVTIKAILSTILTAAMYVVLALWNFFAII